MQWNGDFRPNLDDGHLTVCANDRIESRGKSMDVKVLFRRAIPGEKKSRKEIPGTKASLRYKNQQYNSMHSKVQGVG